jgi:hypothetical protein
MVKCNMVFGVVHLYHGITKVQLIIMVQMHHPENHGIYFTMVLPW